MQGWYTFGDATQLLVDAGYDRRWARQVVGKAEVAGSVTSRRYEVHYDSDHDRFLVVIP